MFNCTTYVLFNRCIFMFLALYIATLTHIHTITILCGRGRISFMLLSMYEFVTIFNELFGSNVSKIVSRNFFHTKLYRIYIIFCVTGKRALSYINICNSMKTHKAFVFCWCVNRATSFVYSYIAKKFHSKIYQLSVQKIISFFVAIFEFGPCKI